MRNCGIVSFAKRNCDDSKSKGERGRRAKRVSPLLFGLFHRIRAQRKKHSDKRKRTSDQKSPHIIIKSNKATIIQLPQDVYCNNTFSESLVFL